MTKIKPNWKPVKTTAPFCPNCDEQLKGNNSIAFPYTCSCGVWVSSWTDPLNFTIKPHNNIIQPSTK